MIHLLAEFLDGIIFFSCQGKLFRGRKYVAGHGWWWHYLQNLAGAYWVNKQTSC